MTIEIKIAGKNEISINAIPHTCLAQKIEYGGLNRSTDTRKGNFSTKETFLAVPKTIHQRNELH